jgi:hypothetical protein
MKKQYIVPSVRMMESESEELLTASGVRSDRGITYGGVDTEGEHEADSRRMRFDSWEED